MNCLRKLRHLDCLLTDLAEIWCTVDLTLDQKSIKIFAIAGHRRPRKGVSDITFEGKKHQPKFKGRTLMMRAHKREGNGYIEPAETSCEFKSDLIH